MKSTVIWSLVGLNLLLAAIVIARAIPVPAATAQVNRPSDYLMIPGKVTGLPYSVVYVLDTTRGGLGGMAYNDSRKRVDTMPPIDLNRIFAAGASLPGNTPAKGGYR
jgi:hypothetical protein